MEKTDVSYIHQFSTDIISCLDDQPGAMNDRDEWRVRGPMDFVQLTQN